MSNQLNSDGVKLLPNSLSAKFTKARLKDSTRQKVAIQRVRDRGLFVRKEMENELKMRQKHPKRGPNIGSDSETDDPD